MTYSRRCSHDDPTTENDRGHATAGLAKRTQEVYVIAVRQLAKHYGKSPDLIYLCFPNNPTGATASVSQLEEWITYARKSRAIILFDAAYEQFIRNEEIPHSIYEIERPVNESVY